MRRISYLFAPIPGHAFFKYPQLKRLLGDDFLQFDGLTFKVFDVTGSGRSRGVTFEAALRRVGGCVCVARLTVSGQP